MSGFAIGMILLIALNGGVMQAMVQRQYTSALKPADVTRSAVKTAADTNDHDTMRAGVAGKLSQVIFSNDTDTGGSLVGQSTSAQMRPDGSTEESPIVIADQESHNDTGDDVDREMATGNATIILNSTQLASEHAMDAGGAIDLAAPDLNQTSVPNPAGSCSMMPHQRNWSSTVRSERFPSVRERICHYMSVWYDENWNTTLQFELERDFRYRNDSEAWAELVVGDEVLTNKILEGVFHVWLTQEEDVIRDIMNSRSGAVNETRHGNRYIQSAYAQDFEAALNRIAQIDAATPVMAQFGDAQVSLSDETLPVFAKFRLIDIRASPQLSQPIVWKLESRRHFKPITRMMTRDQDWKDKSNAVIWRGIMSGYNHDDEMFAEQYTHNSSIPSSDACRKIPRCQLVRNANLLNRTDIDVGFTDVNTPDDEMMSRFAELDGVIMSKPSVQRPHMMRYKYVLSAEGNDVASGLKWLLASNSVVLMAAPTKVTYALENLLEPWIHYVPLAADYSDLEQQIDWTMAHDGEAQAIAQRSKQFMYDLLLHPDADQDNRAVDEEILQRYVSFWRGAVWRYQARGIQTSWRRTENERR